MKISYILSAALLACVASTALSAQAATSAMVDSGARQLQRSTKPPKSASAAALSANTASANSSGGATAKPVRVVQVPAITAQPQTTAAPTTARAAVGTDSGSKSAPPVVRAAKVAKVKPPGE